MATRSTDRKMTLLQYIVQLMRDRFPEHAEFCDEVLYLKKAGLGMCWGSYISVNEAAVLPCTYVSTCTFSCLHKCTYTTVRGRFL